VIILNQEDIEVFLTHVSGEPRMEIQTEKIKNVRIQTLVSLFCAEALLNCSEGVREGILNLSDSLSNTNFVQGLSSTHIQMLVRNRNYRIFYEIEETAFVEESALVSKRDRHGSEGGILSKCSFCDKIGNVSSRCHV
jgi:hypothetical protein